MIKSPIPLILVLGSTGQVGSALLKLLGPRGLGLDRSQANLENPDSILPLLNQIQPAVVINAAAYTAVDLAEKNSELAMKINGDAPGVLAQWCSQNKIPFIHYSTDYVYSGDGENPWNEEDPVAPLNVYGLSKLKGEQNIQALGDAYWIFRTSWVYDQKGKNFLNTMLRLGKERDTLQVVNDQWGAPTYATHLAQATLIALENATNLPTFPSGIYNVCNSGITSWYGFATAIFEMARAKGMSLKIRSLLPIPTSAYPTPAKRPYNSRLNLQKTEKILKIQLPHWHKGLEECMEDL